MELELTLFSKTGAPRAIRRVDLPTFPKVVIFKGVTYVYHKYPEGHHEVDPPVELDYLPAWRDLGPKGTVPYVPSKDLLAFRKNRDRVSEDDIEGIARLESMTKR